MLQAGVQFEDSIRLTPLEREVAALVAKGHSDEEMALLTRSSAQGVNQAVQAILVKLDASSRLDVAWYAIHSGIHIREGPGSDSAA